jgi:hypothetical protein
MHWLEITFGLTILTKDVDREILSNMLHVPSTQIASTGSQGRMLE